LKQICYQTTKAIFMKTVLIILTLLISISCVTSTPSSHTSNQNTTSSETEARKLTTNMKNSLALNTSQEERVLIINVVNISLIKKLRETNQTDQIPKTREKYRTEIKEVLNADQYDKFLVEFGNL
jgi:DNA recombination-dependent growth factor C